MRHDSARVARYLATASAAAAGAAAGSAEAGVFTSEIVAQRLLSCLQYLVPYLSRLQRI